MRNENENLICQICSEYRTEIDHQRPFRNTEEQWQCGTFWFKHGITSLMVRQEEQTETQE